ncbi:MAG: DNA cytosine methyltransferase, partial [Kiritimatiellae bacterium]|nr:DNA cytosine methyltransferase [Kiritimatiellia bacterium]
EGCFLAGTADAPLTLKCNLTKKDTTKYRRLHRLEPSLTLRCGEIFFHPLEDRYLTPREYLRIHSYPDSHVLCGPIRGRTGTVKNLDQHRLVANSVPPPLARAIAEQIIKVVR